MNGCIRFAKEGILGFAAPFRGTWVFLRHPRWWLSGLPVLLLTVLTAVGMGWGTHALLSGWVQPEEGSVLAWAVGLASVAVSLGGLCLLPVVYALFGELFFDSLTVRSRRLLYGLEDREPGFFESLRRSGPVMRYALVSALLYAVLCLPLFFVPMGVAVSEVFFAYRMGVTYLLNAGAAGGEPSEATLKWVCGHRMRVLGFGLGIRLLTAVPVLNIPGLPGILVGAVMARQEGVCAPGGAPDE